MSHSSPADFFNKKTADIYDEKARKIGAINDNLHLLAGLILKPLEPDAKILCVGVGTGTEILALAAEYPGWHFTGIDPSGDMLDVCRDKIAKAGLEERCKLIHGYLSDVPAEREYDAILCLLVTHFIKDDQKRTAMFADMHRRLKHGGILINSEISFDTDSPLFQDILAPWKAMHCLSGATREQAESIPATLREHVNVKPPSAIADQLRQAGFQRPVQFFQSLLIHAWYSKK